MKNGTISLEAKKPFPVTHCSFQSASFPKMSFSRQAGVQLDRVTSGPIVDNYFQTTVNGIFAAGNVVHVYDLVDWVTEAGYAAGKGAALFAQGILRRPETCVATVAGENVRYIVPQKIDLDALKLEKIPLQMRVTHPIEKPVWVEATADGKRIARHAIPYARPGEMTTLNLKPDHTDEIQSGNQITVTILER